MTDVLDPDFWVQVMAGGVRLALPVAVAGLGELIGERSGVINLGIEGQMAIGALAGFMIAFEFGGAYSGLAAGLVVGALVGLLFGWLIIKARGDQIVIGFAITLGGVGLAAFLFRILLSGSASAFMAPPRSVAIPGLSEVPVVGPVLFDQPLIVWLIPVFAFAAAWVLSRTQFGLEIRASGFAPEEAIARGVDVRRVRMLTLAIGGGLAGLAGAILSVGLVGQFTEAIVAGRGFVALALVLASGWRPYWFVAAAFLFGSLQAFSLAAQSLPVDLPGELLATIPYVATLAVLAIWARRANAPTALGRPLA